VVDVVPDDQVVPGFDDTFRPQSSTSARRRVSAPGRPPLRPPRRDAGGRGWSVAGRTTGQAGETCFLELVTVPREDVAVLRPDGEYRPDRRPLGQFEQRVPVRQQVLFRRREVDGLVAVPRCRCRTRSFSEATMVRTPCFGERPHADVTLRFVSCRNDDGVHPSVLLMSTFRRALGISMLR